MKIGGLNISEKDVLIWGGMLGLIIFFGPEIAKMIARKTIAAGGEIVSAVGEATTATGQQIGTASYDWVNPGIPGSTVTGADVVTIDEIQAKKAMLDAAVARGIDRTVALASLAYWHAGQPDPTLGLQANYYSNEIVY
jgi:hypothetical protein